VIELQRDNQTQVGVGPLTPSGRDATAPRATTKRRRRTRPRGARRGRTRGRPGAGLGRGTGLPSRGPRRHGPSLGTRRTSARRTQRARGERAQRRRRGGPRRAAGQLEFGMRTGAQPHRRSRSRGAAPHLPAPLESNAGNDGGRPRDEDRARSRSGNNTPLTRPARPRRMAPTGPGVEPSAGKRARSEPRSASPRSEPRSEPRPSRARRLRAPSPETRLTSAASAPPPHASAPPANFQRRAVARPRKERE